MRAWRARAARRWLQVGPATDAELDRALRAFAAYRRIDREAVLTVVGDGKRTPAVGATAERLGVAEHVRVLPALPPDGLAGLHRDNDVLVHLPDDDPSGARALEAATAGLGVVVTRCGGPEEALDGVAALGGVRFVPTGDDVVPVLEAVLDLTAAADVTPARGSLWARLRPALRRPGPAAPGPAGSRTRTGDVVRCEGLLAARGTVDPDVIVQVWERMHDDVATRVDARVLAAPVARALRKRAGVVSAPPGAPDIRRRAQALASRAAAESATPALRAELRLEALLARLDAGDAVDVATLHEETAPALEAAAAALDAGPDEDPARAVRLLTGALSALMHRTLHCEDLDSALCADPGTFLGPLRATPAYRRLTSPAASARGAARGRDEDAPAPPRRVLLVTSGNQHFSGDVEERVLAAGGEVRRLDVTRRPDGLAPVGLHGLVAERLGLGDAVAPTTAPRPGSQAAELLDWADLVFVDWCLEAAVWASLHVPARARLVVRLHSVEALSVQPHAVDWHRVDDLVFVSEHLRALGTAVLPLPPATRVHVVGNRMRLDRFGTDKSPQASRTLALVGWAQTVKDPLWALDVLAALREHDPAWRLLLAGRDFPDSLTARAWEYRHRVEERLASPALAGAVVRTGHVDDLPAFFRDVGVILSTSLRESFHVGLFEGAASGALPVVRDWPLTSRWGGPSGLVPPGWVVRTPREAAARILGEHVHRTADGEAADWVRARYDQAVLAPALDTVLGLAARR